MCGHLLESLHMVCWYKNVTPLNLSLLAPLSVLFFPSPTEWKEWPKGGHLYLLPLFLVLVVQPVGHLVTWNQVSKGVIAQIDVKGCTSNREASFLPHFALSHWFKTHRWGIIGFVSWRCWSVVRGQQGDMQTFFCLSYCAHLMPSRQNIHQEHEGLAVAKFRTICSHGLLWAWSVWIFIKLFRAPFLWENSISSPQHLWGRIISSVFHYNIDIKKLSQQVLRMKKKEYLLLVKQQHIAAG